LEKAFGRVLTSDIEDLAKSKFQADLEGTSRSWMLIFLKMKSIKLPYVSSQHRCSALPQNPSRRPK
jgi:hypothetical protein